MKKFFQKIFSVKNKDNYKIITILGVKIKILNTKKEIKYLQEQIETLQYIINRTIDISKFPKADGMIRKNQIASSKALKIFDIICKKYNIKYWLDFGTCLGALRHKGFVPWDDDIDVALLREDYNKAIPILKKELEPYGFIVDEGKNYNHYTITRLIYKNSGIQVDLFPYDKYYQANPEEKDINNIVKNFYKAHQEFYNKLYPDFRDGKIDFPRKELESIIKNILLEGKEPVPKGLLIRGIEFLYPECYDIHIEYDAVFPLSHIEFEGYMLPIPNNTNIFLQRLYKNWQEFPQIIYEHSDISYRLNNINIDYEIKTLEDIISKLNIEQ